MNKTVALVGALLATVMLSAVLVVMPIQEVDARVYVKQRSVDKCTGNALCSNTATIIIRKPPICSNCG